MNTLDNRGLKSGENTQGYSNPTPSGARCADPAGFNAGTACTGNCKYSTSYDVLTGEVPIQGIFYALDVDKKPKVFNPLTNLEAKLIINHREYPGANVQRN